MDVDPISGDLFGVSPVANRGVVERIDPRTGDSTVAATIRQSGMPMQIMQIAFAPDGQLYGMAGSFGRTLGIIDVSAGTFVAVVEISDCELIAGIDFSPEGILYAVSVNHDPFEQFVITVDTTAKQVKSVVKTGTLNVGDIDYAPDGYLYATNFSWALLRIDPETGVQKVMGHGQLGALGGLASSMPQVQRDIYVDAAGGADTNEGLSPETAFASIQRGIEVARHGDAVLVLPGVYREEVEFLGKAITVKGVATPTGIPILENARGFAVSFYSAEGTDSVLSNFVIRNSFIGIFMAGSSPTIKNITLVDNDSGIEAYAGSEPDIANCIFGRNIAMDLFQCQARYSRLEEVDEGQHNITAGPRFVDAANGDYHLRSKRGRYWPRHDVWVLDEVSSPCIDGGDPNMPVGQEPIPNGGRINMGAYGGTPYASMNDTPCPCVDGGNQAPEVAIVTPSDGAVLNYANRVLVEAEANDVDGFVARVELFVDGDKVGEDVDGGDGWAVEWTDHPAGDYVLAVRATDDEGRFSDSDPVRVSLRRYSRSSKRYKTNAVDLQVDPNAILQLNPVRFQWKSTGRRDVGLIAEDVAERLADLVIYDVEGRPDGVQYEKLSLYLLRIVQMQQEKLAALQELRSQTAALKARLKVLENVIEDARATSQESVELIRR
ncbi:MAG: tail fiber domain-containing protein [Phycisphaerales bacterium]|nr:MAG: tail fiber domain-containing protein [Phycisphaerales bacterium]